MLSPSTIEKILKELTSGGIESRAGLDNIMVEKGMENFEEMVNIVNTLCTFLGDAPRQEKLKNKINEIETFHKVNFERHLNYTGKSKHSCMCLHCGFHCEDDQIKCPQNHCNYPCKECQDSFTIFNDLKALHDEVEKKFKNDGQYDQTPELEDDLLQWKHMIDICESNLKQLRAHIADKVSESNYDKENYDLQEGECLCVLDYKMKVLPRSYREKMIDWYSKRGISVLGVEIHILVGGERKVFYHFLISDDANQDAEAVLCAKHFLYTSVLPQYKISKVKFRCDGAGCFSASQAKASMALWSDLQLAAKNSSEDIPSVETMYKVMVAGCGKTALDGMFGILTMHLVRLVNYGHSFANAESLFLLLQEFPLNQSTYHLFKPNRKLLKFPKPDGDQKNKSNLNSLHLIQFDPGTGKAVGKYHSHIGTDINYSYHSTKGLQKGRNENVNRAVLEWKSGRVHVIRTTFDYDAKFDDLVANASANRDKRSHQERKHKENLDRIDKSKKNLTDRWDDYNKEIEARGLFCCRCEENETLNRCMYITPSKKALEDHLTRGKHSFPKVDLATNLHRLHLEGRLAFCLATGSMINRSSAVNKSNHDVQVGSSTFQIWSEETCSVVNSTEIPLWCKKGCYNTTRKTVFTGSAVLREDLEKLFLQGYDRGSAEKSSANKYTPAEAYTYLANLKLPNGRRKYSYAQSNKNGELPTTQYIKQWFSNRANSYKQEVLLQQREYGSVALNILKKAIREVFEIPRLSEKIILGLLVKQHSTLFPETRVSRRVYDDVSQLKAFCEENSVPFQGKEALVKILQMKDQIEKE